MYTQSAPAHAPPPPKAECGGPFPERRQRRREPSRALPRIPSRAAGEPATSAEPYLYRREPERKGLRWVQERTMTPPAL